MFKFNISKNLFRSVRKTDPVIEKQLSLAFHVNLQVKSKQIYH